MFILSILSACFAILAATAALGTAIVRLITACVKHESKKNKE